MNYDLVIDNTLTTTGDLCFLASLSMNIADMQENKIKLKYDDNNAAYHVKTWYVFG